MIVSGSKALSEGFVSDLSSSQAQPCGIDLTLKEVHGFQDGGEIDFDNSHRRISKTVPLQFEGDEIHLKAGCYKIIYNEYAKIPLDCGAFGFPRSSVLRCGADIHCAVWDPGYHGRSESLMIVHNPHGITLHRNAKVLQLVFIRLEEKAKQGYEGIYKGENK